MRPSRQRTLSLINRQDVRGVDLRLLRRVVRALLREAWPRGSFDLVVHLVAAPEMTRLNEAFLHHKGSTDVITFDYSEGGGQASRLSAARSTLLPANPEQDTPAPPLHGEILVCLDEAVSQARRFRGTWQSELVRYVVHGVLHLLGYDDQEARSRRRMRRLEDGLVRHLARQFELDSLGPSRQGDGS